METKRVRFKGPKIGIDDRRRSKFDGCSAPVEAREDSLMPDADAGEPKTSEFAYFKRLKQGVGRTSRMNPVNRENIEVRNLGHAYNGKELGNAEILKDLEAPVDAKKSSTLDVGSFLRPQDVVIQSAGIHSKVDDDTKRLESSPGLRTPTTIDLDNVLSTSAATSVNTGIQLKDGDIFSSKRLKLQQWISKTLFLEADNHKLPKECDVVSLLMSRLLPESSSNTPSESKNNGEPELKDKYQECLHDSSIEFDECWDGTQKLIQANVDPFLGCGISAAYCQINEDVNTFASTCTDSMLLEFKEGNKRGSSLNEIDSERWSDMFDDRNLLTWRNNHCDYSPQCKNSSNIFKNEVHNQFYDGVDSDQSSKVRIHTHSYELPTTTICYDRFADRCSRRDFLEYIDERHDCNLDRRAPDSWHPVSFERFGSSGFGNIRDSAELNEFEIRHEYSPLLLPWITDDTNTKALTHLTDLDHEVYHSPSWSENDQSSLDSNTSLDINPSIVPRSSCTPFTVLYSHDDADLLKDVLRGSHFYVISEDHNHYTGNIIAERVVPAGGALLIAQGLDSAMGLRQTKSSSRVFYEYEKIFKMPRAEELSLMNVDIPTGGFPFEAA